MGSVKEPPETVARLVLWVAVTHMRHSPNWGSSPWSLAGFLVTVLVNWKPMARPSPTVTPHVSGTDVGPVEWSVHLKLDRHDLLSVIKKELYNTY